MRVVRYEIQTESIVRLFVTGAAFTVNSGFPSTGKVIRAGYMADTDAFSLLVEDASFADIPEGTVAPLANFSVTTT